MLPKHRENTGNLVYSSRKFSDSKDTAYGVFAVKFTDFWHEFLKLARGKFRVKQGKCRENTGNLKVGFKWGPWLIDWV